MHNRIIISLIKSFGATTCTQTRNPYFFIFKQPGIDGKMRAKNKVMYSRKCEDYLETILRIVKQKGYARTKDVSDAMGNTPASVAEMFKKLHDEGLVIYRKYEGVTLTDKGKKVAREVQIRHTIMKKFLEIIEVPLDIADRDACIMEHHLNPKTIDQINKLVLFIETSPTSAEWIEDFNYFCESGEHNKTE